ncbi:hypothetical protein, partial [Dialister succinatiphilus]|uniref:hypothetical protein n=1 Tax=Dialister succinatiphilus TaxID=487173 RepID=UPI004028F7BB
GKAVPLFRIGGTPVAEYSIRKGAKRPENRVTRFPVEKVRRSRIRGAAPLFLNCGEAATTTLGLKGRQT